MKLVWHNLEVISENDRDCPHNSPDAQSMNGEGQSVLIPHSHE